MKPLTILFIFVTFLIQAQDSAMVSYTAGIRINRVDFFIQATRQTNFHNFRHEFGVGIGINRTIFQQRFFPELSYRFSYDVLQKERFSLGPAVSLFTSMYQVNKNTNAWHFFQEGLLGFWMEYGRRYKIRLNVGAGVFTESFKSAINSRYSHHATYGYNGQISFSYAL